MSEQPINPDDMTAWCGACQSEVKGNVNWIKHLESSEHLSNVENFSESNLVKADQIEKKSRTGTKVGVGILVGLVALFVFSPNLIQFAEDQLGFEIITPDTENLADTPIEITIDESKTVERKTTLGNKLEYNPDVIEILVHQYTNEQRELHGLDPVRFDYEIADIARMHSLDMSEQNYFAHDNLDGMSASDRGRDAGYRCFKMVGNAFYSGLSENLFRGGLYDSVQTLNGVPVSYNWLTNEEIAHTAVDGWMNSEGHRKNILTSMFSKEGIGVIIDSENRVYVTQNFC